MLGPFIAVRHITTRKRQTLLSIFCRNPDFLKEYRSDLKRRKATIIVDDPNKLEGSGLELKEMKEHFAKQFKDMTVEGVRYGLDCIMINAGRCCVE